MRVAREIVDPQLILKATPPKAARIVLPRPRLSIVAAEFAEKSVIAVTASPGFGKTALLAQWRRELLAGGAIVAWLTVDQWDDEARFLEGLAVAMFVATSRAISGQDFSLYGSGNSPFNGISRWLIDIAAFAGDVVLILDDVHTMPQATIGSFAYLLNNAPENLKVVLGSRKPLNLPMSDLIARGEYASVDTESLRLQAAETAAVLSARFGARIDVDSCARLHELTEGWALGLQLAIANIEKQPSIREAVAGCLARSGDIRRFFVESLIERLVARDAEFLVRVSFLDALQPDLCRAVTGNEDSAAILERLCDLTPILTEGAGSSWLRIHALTREFLSELFEALPDASKRRYRSTAAKWLAEHRFYEEAARHALGAGKAELAYEYAERSLYEVFLTGQTSRVAQWLDRLPPAALEHRPRLRIALGWSLAQSERNAEAAAIVQPILDDGLAGSADRFESAQITATAAAYADDLDAASAVMVPWRERTSGHNAVQRLVSANLEGIAALHQGAPEQARLLLTQPSSQGIEAGRYAVGWRDWLLSTSYLWQGQVLVAEEVLRDSLAAAEPIAGRRSPVACMLAATLAAVLWERDQHDEIAGLLADRRDVIDQHVPPDVISMSYIVAARAAALEGSVRIAYDLLERLFAIGENRRLPRLCVTALAEQMRMSALEGRQRSCEIGGERLEQVLAKHGPDNWGMLQRFVELQAGMAGAYLHVVRKEWEKATTVLARIKPLAEKLRRNKDHLQIHLLDALAAKRSGNDSDAMLREGLFIIDALGLKRLLADTHPALVGWAQSMDSEKGVNQRMPAPAEGGKASPHGAQLPGQKIGSTRVAPSALLTPKERDIIRLLANNLSNKEIASALDLSTQTVKWHLKNLFGKFNAASRKHLLDRARSLGIIGE